MLFAKSKRINVKNQKRYSRRNEKEGCKGQQGYSVISKWWGQIWYNCYKYYQNWVIDKSITKWLTDKNENCLHYKSKKLTHWYENINLLIYNNNLRLTRQQQSRQTKIRFYFIMKFNLIHFLMILIKVVAGFQNFVRFRWINKDRIFSWVYRKIYLKSIWFFNYYFKIPTIIKSRVLTPYFRLL